MQTEYQLMPKRSGKSDGSFKGLSSCKFFTNYYDISLDNQRSTIYQYSFALPQNIPQDSSIYHRAICSIKQKLNQKIGYLSHSGQMIWGSKALKVPTTIQCEFDHQKIKYTIQSLIKMTKELNLKQLDNQKTRQIYLQILNVNLKCMFKAVKLNPLGKQSQYFKKDLEQSKELSQKNLCVLKGFRFTLTTLNSGLYLQVDVCSRVLQSKNLLQMHNRKIDHQIAHDLKGKIVITRYGTYRTYKVQQVDFSKTPLSKFNNQHTGKETSYVDYYKEAYGLKINDTKQPLILAIKNTKKVMKDGGKKLQIVNQYVYLVPELVAATGMTDLQRSNHQTMKALAPFTKLQPDQRISQCAEIIQQLNGQRGLIQIKNPKRFQGFVLPTTVLKYGSGNIKPNNKGIVNQRGLLKQRFHFTDWLFVYSESPKNNKQRDIDDSDDAVGILMKASQTYGIKFNQPQFIGIKGGSINNWKQQLASDLQKNGAPQIIVLYLTQYEQKFYGQLKRFITNELKVPSQFIRRKTLNNPKGALSAASKIVIQMNVKVGSVPWQVQKRHPYFKGKNVMYGGLSISKGKKGYTMAFVGTINSDCTKVFSDCKVGIKEKQNIPMKDYAEIFTEWAKSYYQNNGKKVPQLIILYRQGLSEVQTKNQLPRGQIPALEQMARTIEKKTQTPNYKPQVIIVTVNKKINSRYFNVLKQDGKLPKVANVDSGSIMLDPFSSSDSYDFHLAAQYVTQGTCTPTLFRIAYDTSKMPQQALINFTYEQCFNYYNWEGAVRVPACLQSADKLSNLVSTSFGENIVQSPVTKKYFFL